MLNRYPAWKNALIFLVVLLGLLYSVPNLYPDDEAIQISSELSPLTEFDIERATTALEAAQLNFFGAAINDESLLVRLDSVEDQLRAKTALENAFGPDYIYCAQSSADHACLDAVDRCRKNEPWP